MSATDRVERSILIQAPPARVWRAVSQAEEVGRWFGADLAGKRFAVGERTIGQITIPGFCHVPFDVILERIDPQTQVAWRWHPYAVDQKLDYEGEPRTLVTFTLQAAEGGTLLTVVESGFDQLWAARRAEARRMNDGGWQAQLENVARYATAG